MSRQTEVSLAFIADIKDIKKSLGQLPGISERETKRMVKQLNRNMKQAEKQARQAARAGRDSWDRFGNSIKLVDDAAGAFNNRLSNTVKGWYRAGQAFKGFGAAVGPVGAGLLAAGVAATVAGGAIIGLTAAAFKAVQATENLAKEQEHLSSLEGFEPIPPAALQSIQNTNGAVQAFREVVNRAFIALGTNLAPTLEKVSVNLVALGLAGLDTWKTFTEGQSIIRAFTVFLTGAFIKALSGPVNVLFQLSGAVGSLLNALGLSNNIFKQAQEGWEAFVNSAAEGIVDGTFDALSKGLDGVSESTGDYGERARALIATVNEKRLATEKTTKATKDLGKAQEDLSKIVAQANQDLLTEEDKIGAAFDKRLAQIAKIEEDTGKTAATEAARAAALQRYQRDLQAFRDQEQEAIEAAQQAEEDRLAAERQARQDAQSEMARMLIERQGGEELINQSYRDRLALIDALEQASGDKEQADLLRREAEKEHAEEMADFRRRALEDILDQGMAMADAMLMIREGLAELNENHLADLERKGEAQRDLMQGLTEEIQDLKEQRKNASDEATRKEIDDQLASAQNKRKQEHDTLKLINKEAKKAFDRKKAADISAALINGSVAVTRALAELGPIAGPAAAAGIGLTVAAQVNSIRKQEPPTFHGGYAPLSGGPDEYNARLLNGEAVLNKRATLELGPQTISALNQGQPMQPMQANIVIDGRVVQEAVVDTLDSTMGQRYLSNRTGLGLGMRV